MNPFIQQSQTAWHRVNPVSKFHDLQLNNNYFPIAPNYKIFNIFKINIGPLIKININLPENLKK